jgi:hypothetical protein
MNAPKEPMKFARSDLSDWKWVQTGGPDLAEEAEKDREEYALVAEKVFADSASEDTPLNRFLHNLCIKNRTLRLPRSVGGRQAVEVRRTELDIIRLCEGENPKKTVLDAFAQALLPPENLMPGDILEVRWVNRIDKHENPFCSLGYFLTTLYPAKNPLPDTQP